MLLCNKISNEVQMFGHTQGEPGNNAKNSTKFVKHGMKPFESIPANFSHKSSSFTRSIYTVSIAAIQ